MLVCLRTSNSFTSCRILWRYSLDSPTAIFFTAYVPTQRRVGRLVSPLEPTYREIWASVHIATHLRYPPQCDVQPDIHFPQRPFLVSVLLWKTGHNSLLLKNSLHWTYPFAGRSADCQFPYLPRNFQILNGHVLMFGNNCPCLILQQPHQGHFWKRVVGRASTGV